MPKDVDKRKKLCYKEEYKWLKSEERELEGFLKDLPEDDIFMRPGFLHRLEKVKNELKDIERRRQELMPCPFCESTNVGVTFNCDLCYVECYKCGMTGPNSSFCYGCDRSEKEELVISRWNCLPRRTYKGNV